jgi:hypothetical protein
MTLIGYRLGVENRSYSSFSAQPVALYDSATMGSSDTAQPPLGASYSSFSGADITATVVVPGVTEPITFATLKTVSYSIVRDKRPVRILGITNPIGWCMSARLVAGTLIFTSFDRYVWSAMYGADSNTTAGRYVLADTLPAFDITISALNEYGQMSRLMIRGARIVDEGGVIGVDDMYVEQTHTYVAIDVIPWIPGNPDPDAVKQGIFESTL